MIQKTTSLKQILKLSERCSQCGNCCSYGAGFLFGDDLKNIAEFLNITQKELKKKYLEEVEQFNKILLRPRSTKKPFGPCIFLKKNLCSIQPVKPLHCKIGNCNKHGEQLSAWFTLNYLIDKNDPESIRQYKIYLESGGKLIEGGKLQDLIPNRNRLKRILEYRILR